MISGDTNLRSGLKLWLIGKPVLIVLEGNRQRKASRSESNQTNEQHWLSHGQTEEPATVVMAGWHINDWRNTSSLQSRCAGR
jgi:hypothetical protein